MAGKKEHFTPMWDSLRKEGIDLEPPVPLSQNVYLGCGQKIVQPNMALISQKREMFQRICHSSDFGKPTSSAGGGDPLKETLQGPSATDSKPTRSKKKKNLIKANNEIPTALPAGGDPKWLQGGKISAYAYEMCGHVKQTVDQYLELAGKPLESLKKVATPCIDDHQIPPEEFALEGELSPFAARMVLKAVYLARTARMDLM